MKKLLLLTALLGLMVGPATAAIVQQNTADLATAPVNASGVAEAPLTISSFDGTSGNYVIVSAISKTKAGAKDGSTNPLTSLTYGGVAMTLLGSQWATQTYEVYTDLYGIATSASGDIVANFTTADPTTELHDEISIVAVSYSGVGSVSASVTDKTPDGSNTNKMHGTTIATTGTNSLIVLGIGWGGPDTAAVVDGTDSYTLVEDVVGTNSKARNSIFSLAAPTAGTYAMDATFSGSTRGSMVGVELLPEPATMGLLAIGGIGMLLRRRR